MKQRSSTTPDKNAGRAVLLIPSDTETLVGGKGDEAMTLVIVSRIRAFHPHASIHTLVETQEAAAAARELGLQPVFIEGGDGFVAAFGQWMSTHPLAMAVAIGADAIDGAYGIVGPARMLIMLDMAARSGARAVLMGFSVRPEPSPELRPLFEKLDPRVVVNLRDPLSRQRLDDTYGIKGNLVADTAFLLEEEHMPDIALLARWIDERRGAGRRVLGLNIHPMLFGAADASGRAAFLETMKGVIQRVSREHPISWVLIPHDFRGVNADRLMLDPLHHSLKDELGQDMMMLDKDLYGSGELKAISSLMDGVVTARMHLAIASLGSGVPIFGFVYQDKFEGLLHHFDLPDWLAVSPDLDEDEIVNRLSQYVTKLDALRDDVRKSLPRVRERAEGNFLSFGPLPAEPACP